MDDFGLEDLIKGAIDMHVHSNPDLTLRKQSDIETVRAVKQIGMQGVLLKCHHGSTTARASLARECVDEINVWGGIVLNRPVGGLNLAAVETDLALGAKEVWMPTISAVNHLQFGHRDIRKAVPVTDANGKLLPAVYEILELVAKADVILGTGHLSVPECLLLIKAAQSKGVKKVLVTHPEWEATAMPIAIQKDLAAQGILFERCFYASNSPQQLPVQEVVNQVRAVGPEFTVLSSDFGQIFNEEPVLGFRRFLHEMLTGGICRSAIEIMIKGNPRQLLM